MKMEYRIAVLLCILIAVCGSLAGCATLTSPKVVRTFGDNKGNSIVFLDAPCTTTAGVFAGAPAEVRAKMKAATVHWQGKDYAACWTPIDEHYDYVVDETGDQGAVPKEGAKKQSRSNGTLEI